MSDIPLGTYIGHGSADGCDCSYTLKLNEKNLFWLDYKKKPPVATAPPEQFHVDGKFVAEGSKLKCTFGGLPGQGRQGEVWDFDIVLGAMDIKSLKREGVALQPQHDTMASGGADVSMCAGCGEKCTGEFVKVGGDTYHKECFTCDKCKAPLTGKFKKTADGQKLCGTCQPREYCRKCQCCLVGKKMKVGEDLYHPECFTCDVCEWPLSGGFFKKDDKTMCKDCCDGKPVKPDAPPRPDYSKDGKKGDAPAAAAPAPTPKMVETAKPKELMCKLGPYMSASFERKPDDHLPETCKYTITLLEDNQLWLDFEAQSKISSSKWHVEGEYEETSVTNIRYTVEANPFGGGPAKGTVVSLNIDPQAETITFDGRDCKFGASITSVEMENISKDAPTRAAPAPAASAASTGEFLTLAQLQDEKVWKAAGVDASSRENALSDSEFQSLFGMDKKAFADQPKWKKETTKKKHKLY